MLDSLKLSVSVGVDVVPLTGVRWFYLFVLNEEPRFRDPRRAESNFRARRFTRPETLTVSDRCYTASYCREDILSAVEFARGADTAVRPEKPPDAETLSAEQEREKERGRGEEKESFCIV